MAQVTVITPSLNYAHFIDDALASVRGQKGAAVLHLVQDGGSSDDTAEVVGRYPEVEWHCEQDTGQSDALNKALERVTAPWVGWLNADEFYLPGALDMLIAHGERTGADVVYGDAVFVDAEGRLQRLLPQHRFSNFVLRHYGCYIPTCATVFRRGALGESPWDDDARLVMDWRVFLKIQKRGGRYAHVKYPAGAFRVHDDRVSAAPMESFGKEIAATRRSFGINRTPPLAGHIAHAALKALDGAYLRQLRAQKLRSADLRWFASEAGHGTVDRLLRQAYRGAARR
ncbi:MAG TPA: glycosyltransferase [Actinomycetota bacterium]|nr:glycosyltransferase [Actinomycetota bacterium]